MSEWADPELLVGAWLRDTLSVKVWVDPKPPTNKWTTAPWLWVQRGQGGDTLALTLDDVLLDCDAYAANADHARQLGQKAWAAMTLQLPKHTFSNGVFVTSSTCFSRPAWAPDPQYRRAAAYRLILHSLIP